MLTPSSPACSKRKTVFSPDRCNLAKSRAVSVEDGAARLADRVGKNKLAQVEFRAAQLRRTPFANPNVRQRIRQSRNRSRSRPESRHKIRHDSSADRKRKTIGNNRRCGRSVSAFPHAHEETHGK